MNAMDLNFRLRIALGSRRDVVWGVAYRSRNDKIAPGYDVTFSPLQRMDNLLGIFVRDDVKVTDSLWLTLRSNSNTTPIQDSSGDLMDKSFGRCVTSSSRMHIKSTALRRSEVFSEGLHDILDFTRTLHRPGMPA